MHRQGHSVETKTLKPPYIGHHLPRWYAFLASSHLTRKNILPAWRGYKPIYKTATRKTRSRATLNVREFFLRELQKAKAKGHYNRHDTLDPKHLCDHHGRCKLDCDTNHVVSLFSKSLLFTNMEKKKHFTYWKNTPLFWLTHFCQIGILSFDFPKLLML